MSIKILALAAGAVIVLPLAALAASDAGPGPRHGFAGHEEHGPLDFLRGVTLTDAQRTQIHALMHDSFANAKAQMEQLHSLHQQIEDAILAPGTVNGVSLKALQQKASALRDQLDAARLDTALQVRAMLTPSQQAQAASIHAQLESLHQQEHEIMHGAAPDAGPDAPPRD